MTQLFRTKMLASAAIFAMPLVLGLPSAHAASSDPDAAKKYEAEADQLIAKDDFKSAEIELKNAVKAVGSSRVDLQACKLEYSIVSPK